MSVLLEEDAGHVTTVRYTLAPFGYGDLVSQRRSDATSWYHFDGLGSMRALTDAGAAVTDTALYQAFGTRVATTGSTTHNYRWVGKLGYAAEQWLDGYLLRRRYYQEGPGRFLSRDPMGGAVGDYRYVGQRATRLVDPSGYAVEDVWPIIRCAGQGTWRWIRGAWRWVAGACLVVGTGILGIGHMLHMGHMIVQTDEVRAEIPPLDKQAACSDGRFENDGYWVDPKTGAECWAHGWKAWIKWNGEWRLIGGTPEPGKHLPPRMGW